MVVNEVDGRRAGQHVFVGFTIVWLLSYVSMRMLLQVIFELQQR